MLDFRKSAGFLTAAILAAGLSASSAGAVTVTTADGVYDIAGPGDETQFIGDVKDKSGGSGSYSVTFNASNATSAEAKVTVGALVASTFQNLMMSWVSGSGTNSTPVVPVETSLSTIFADPESLSQMLVFTWEDSLVNSGFDFEVQVSPIPLPAAGLMLLTAVGGLGAIRSRRKAV